MNKYIKAVLAPVYWQIMNRLRGHQVESTQVGFRARIGRHVIIREGSEVESSVEIGDYSYISGPRAYIEAATIGKFCSIARQTTIGVSGHDYKKVTTHPFIIDPAYEFVCENGSQTQKLPPVIGHDVWIGMNCVVHRGVTIGHGAVIASDAVVTTDVRPYSIVGGNPARHIKYRFSPEVIDSLLRIEWWNWDEIRLKGALAEFDSPERFVKKYACTTGSPPL